MTEHIEKQRMLAAMPRLHTAMLRSKELLERSVAHCVGVAARRGFRVPELSDLVAFYEIMTDIPEDIFLHKDTTPLQHALLLELPVFDRRGIAFNLRQKGAATGIDIHPVTFGEYGSPLQRDRGIALDKSWHAPTRRAEKEPMVQVSCLSFTDEAPQRNFLEKACFPVENFDELRTQIRRAYQKMTCIPLAPARREFSYTLMPAATAIFSPR